MNDFIKYMRNGVEFYTVSLFEKENMVKTGFSTRKGGVSKGIFESLNFSFTTGDNKENVLENYKRYSDALGLDINKMVMTKQVHKAGVHIADEKDFGIFLNDEFELPEADALITDKRGVTLVKFSADCPIIYLLDEKNGAVGLVHSGWRSTEMNIVANTLGAMEKQYNTNARDVLAAIGPSIFVCCFEVGNEVAEIFKNLYGEKVIDTSYKKPHVDLKKVLELQLKECGVKEENIAYTDLCTGCNTDEFHSYRLTKGQCGLSIGTITLI